MIVLSVCLSLDSVLIDHALVCDNSLVFLLTYCLAPETGYAGCPLQQASESTLRASDAAGLSFGKAITFQHVGGASPGSAAVAQPPGDLSMTSTQIQTGISCGHDVGNSVFHIRNPSQSGHLIGHNCTVVLWMGGLCTCSFLMPVCLFPLLLFTRFFLRTVCLFLKHRRFSTSNALSGLHHRLISLLPHTLKTARWLSPRAISCGSKADLLIAVVDSLF